MLGPALIAWADGASGCASAGWDGGSGADALSTATSPVEGAARDLENGE